MKDFRIGSRVGLNANYKTGSMIGQLGIVERYEPELDLYGVKLDSGKCTWCLRSELTPLNETFLDDDKTEIIEQPQLPPVALTLTLPTDSIERKNYPMFSGLLKYFPAALAGVANVSKLGNDKHNPGQPLHHARGKSTDHGDCILRHLTDVEDLLAARSRGVEVTNQQILLEVSQMVWRSLAFAQEIHESLGAPLAPGAKLDSN